MRPLTVLLLAVGLASAGSGCDAQDRERTSDDAAPGSLAAQSSPEAGQDAAPNQDAGPGAQGARVSFGQTMGDPEAPIQVVEFSDFGCPYCARFARSTLPEIRDDYIERGIVHWRYVPVVFGFPGGEAMGAAAVCAAELGGAEGFWQAHDLLYERQTALRGDDTRARLLEWLPETGLDRDRLEQCLDDPATRDLLVSHTRTAQEWYVRGTPTFLINGVPMAGAMPYEFFEKVFATVLDPRGL
jgi:protein-disulfide isomerase